MCSVDVAKDDEGKVPTTAAAAFDEVMHGTTEDGADIAGTDALGVIEVGYCGYRMCSVGVTEVENCGYVHIGCVSGLKRVKLTGNG